MQCVLIGSIIIAIALPLVPLPMSIPASCTVCIVAIYNLIYIQLALPKCARDWDYLMRFRKPTSSHVPIRK